MTDPLRIVATLALDERDAAVLGAVEELAARRPCDVVLLHVRRDDTDVTAIVGAAAARVGVAATVRIARGEVDAVAADVLAEVDAGLLVVGRSPAEEGAAAWGPHGKALLRAAGCPVLVVPVGVAMRYGRAAVGMDLSDAALDALALAGGLFDEVVAVSVVAPEEASMADGAAAIQTRFVEALHARGLAPVPLYARAGDSPADALLALGADVDALVVGSRGLSPLAAVFLGSTAERLAGRNPGPVLVVRRRGEARGLLGALFG